MAGLTAIVSLPLLVAVVALSRKHWSPVLDLAMTELRVRDVGSRRTPLIGLPGRIGNFPEQGSHPGPISFYLLAPTYRLFGARAWSLELGSALIHIGAVAAALTLAFRRGGVRLCAAFAVVLAVVLNGYGASVLTQPWNPYLPVIAWMVVLLAAWSILEGDAAAPVFFVAAGSLCAQTHVPYLALVGGLGASILAWLLIRSGLPDATTTPARNPVLQRVDMPGARRWAIVALVVGVVMWLAPVTDQIRRTPGNLAMLRDYFQSPPEDSIGFGAGLRHLLRHFDVTRLGAHAFDGAGAFTATSFELVGSVVPGVLLLAVWAATATIAWRMGHRALIHLHAVVASCLVIAVVAMSRIFGKLWYYLTFWAWGLLALTLFAMMWTLAAAVASAQPQHRSVTLRVAFVAGVAVLGVSMISFTWSAAGADPPEDHLSATLTAVVAPTAEALEDGVGSATGRTGRYVVTWSDAAYFGSQGYGLVNELERHGFDVGVPATWRVPVTPQRVIDAAEATAEVHLATGTFIEQWRAMPGVVEVAFVEPRDASQLASYVELREQVADDLAHLGLTELIAILDTNLFGVQLDERVPPDVQARVNRMLLLGQPTAVFIAPPGTSS
ncbi:MAG: hypothetical protein ABIW84_02255 [Ilumatobacteraceae bacterium]